jgi:HEAT repeats
MHILEGFGDRRLALIALRELDAGADSMLRFQAALALVRTAAAAALREIKDQRAIPPLRNALNDPDPNVRYQAAMSLRFLETEGSISEVDVAEATERMMKTFGTLGIKLP